MKRLGAPTPAAAGGATTEQATVNGSVLLCWALAAAVACAWLVAGPRTPDLAAQVFRVQVFADHGFALYDTHWYDGHLLPAYSVLFPPLGALLGVRVAGALATAAAIVLFDQLARIRFGDRAWRGTAWFAGTAGMNLFSARLTFALGLAVGLAALLAAHRARAGLALVLAAACTLASPLAGLFLAGCAAVWALGERRLRPVLLLLPAALIPLVALEVAFPEGGTFGFDSDQLQLLLAVLAVGLVLLPPRQRVLRLGFALYAAGAVVAYLLPSPVGYNYVRLALIVGGPLLACALTGWRALALAAVAPLMLGWSWLPSKFDLQAVGGPSANASYYAPVVSFLSRHTYPPARVEIPFTRGHWESVYVGGRFLLARGWERQLDRLDNPLFYRPTSGVLDAGQYRRWLTGKGVKYVALPDAALDSSAWAEGALIERRPGFLREVFHSSHWRVFAVRHARPLLDGPGRLRSVRTDSFTIDVRHPGWFLIRLRFSPYWQVSEEAGCVMRGAAGWTALRLTQTGIVRVSSDFDLGRALSHSPRCA